MCAFINSAAHWPSILFGFLLWYTAYVFGKLCLYLGGTPNYLTMWSLFGNFVFIIQCAMTLWVSCSAFNKTFFWNKKCIFFERLCVITKKTNRIFSFNPSNLILIKVDATIYSVVFKLVCRFSLQVDRCFGHHHHHCSQSHKGPEVRFWKRALEKYVENITKRRILFYKIP